MNSLPDAGTGPLQLPLRTEIVKSLSSEIYFQMWLCFRCLVVNPLLEDHIMKHSRYGGLTALC